MVKQEHAYYDPIDSSIKLEKVLEDVILLAMVAILFVGGLYNGMKNVFIFILLTNIAPLTK